MQDKRVLGQFHAKIAKAKVLHDSTVAINAKLYKQYIRLHRENQQATQNMIKIVNEQHEASRKLQNIKNAVERQAQILKHTAKQVSEQRKIKKQLQRQKLICESEISKLALQIEELNKTKQKLEQNSRVLDQKLSLATTEKEILKQQYEKTQVLIYKCTKTSAELEKQIVEMRNLISANTVPVYNPEKGERLISETWDPAQLLGRKFDEIVHPEQM